MDINNPSEFMKKLNDPKFMEEFLGHKVDYNFNDLLKSSNSDVKYLAQELLTMHTALDNVVKSKSTYLGSALHTEKSQVDALLVAVGFFRNIVKDIWTKYDVNKRFHIEE